VTLHAAALPKRDRRRRAAPAPRPAPPAAEPRRAARSGEPHWYVHMLGVSPLGAREGTGRALMRLICALADDDAREVHLEVSGSRCRAPRRAASGERPSCRRRGAWRAASLPEGKGPVRWRGWLRPGGARLQEQGVFREVRVPRDADAGGDLGGRADPQDLRHEARAVPEEHRALMTAAVEASKERTILRRGTQPRRIGVF
jgi:hypothetical protein